MLLEVGIGRTREYCAVASQASRALAKSGFCATLGGSSVSQTIAEAMRRLRDKSYLGVKEDIVGCPGVCD